MKNQRAERRLHPVVCPCCREKRNSVGRRRQNTQFIDGNSNYLISCRPCFEEGEKYWAERWADYYSGLL